MMLYLEAADFDFVDRINYGPRIPKKLIPHDRTTLEHYVDRKQR